jgi:hypothetical protein
MPVHSDFLVGVRILSILFVITRREENVNLIDIEIFDVYNNELYIVDLLVRVKG